ncbi:MAG: protecting protein DprA [Gemmatimonadetes bacterium]|nr:protecting protein DprA [Gemmatimonadota bacterium]
MRFRDLIATFGSPLQAWDATPLSAERAAAAESASSALERADRAGARLIASGDHEYPDRLHELPDPPPILFAIGALERLQAPCVAIVGTRRATSYGERVTLEIAAALARAGVTVISGMARGIDGAAHRAALAAGGGTVAVLGTGVDIAYPAAHRALHAQIADHGLLLSEELPGDRASGGSFPKRNRIIAALASVTIVIEAPHRSGALITAVHALDLGRDVAAVPGPIDVPQSAGSNALLRDGAIMIAEVADALALVGASLSDDGTSTSIEAPAPSDVTQRAVWEALDSPAPDLDTLAARASLPARRCLAAVSALELSGAIECALTGEIRRLGMAVLRVNAP